MLRKIFLTVLCVGILVALGAAPAAAQKKVKDLEYPALNKFDIPAPNKTVLPNGLSIYYIEDNTLPLVTMSARLNRCGSYLEPADEIGLASVCGSVMRTGGTTSMTGDEIDEELEGIGATVETSIRTTSGSAYVSALSEYADRVTAILADILRNPVFDEDKIELAKTEQKAGISRRNDDPMQVNIREFRKVVYGADSPYARHTEYVTVDAITRDDLVNFHKKYVQPNNIQIAVWGDIDQQAAIDLITKYFGDWERGKVEVPPPPDVDYDYKSSVNYCEKTDVNQSNIFLGHIGGKMGDPDYPATIVMNSILGGGFGSRLFNNVRTKEGLAYATYGTFTFNYDYPGICYAFASTKSGSTVKAIREIKKQVESMQTDLPTEDEMKQAKDGFLNSFVFNFDTKSEVVNRLMTYDYYGLPRDYLQQIKEGVEKVTPQDVIEVAKRKLHPDAMQIVVTGNAADFDTTLAVFGKVNEVDISIPEPTAAEFAASDEELTKGMATFAKVVQACGGKEQFAKINNTKYEATITLNMPQGSMNAEVSSLVDYPGRMAQTMTLPMGTRTSVYITTEGWNTMGEQSMAMPESELKDNRENMERDLIKLFKAFSSPYYKIAYRGEKQFAGKSALQLDFNLTHGGQFTMFVDPQTNLPTGMKYMGQSQTGPAEMTEDYKDFGEYAGKKLPSVKSIDAGQMTIDVKVTDRQFNVAVDESMFTKPEGI